MARIEMTNEVKAKLQPYVDEGKVLLLDLDNGLGPYSDEGNCALVTKFRFIAIDLMHLSQIMKLLWIVILDQSTSRRSLMIIFKKICN